MVCYCYGYELGACFSPSEMVKTGEEITVCIIDIDQNRERVSLGLKQLSSTLG